MSLFSLLGAVEIGLIFSLVALGVFISFRLLRFPDLTVDGSFPLGGAVCAILISTGTNPWLATLAGTAAGAVAGLITGWLNVDRKSTRLNSSHLVISYAVFCLKKKKYHLQYYSLTPRRRRPAASDIFNP